MAQYKTGSVSVTNGSAVVTGTGTLWVGEVAVGDIFTIVGSNAWYEVGAVNSNTQITLTANYAGTTITDSTYAISRDFTANYGLPYPQKGDIETASLIKRAFQDIDSKLVLTSSSGDVTITGDLIVEGSTISLDNATVQTFTWGDNDKAIFGDGSDLQIYHDGNHSYIQDAGTGHLRLLGNNLQILNGDNTANYIICSNGGAVDLYHNNAKKFATTSTGIDVTGLTDTDTLNVSGNTTLGDASTDTVTVNGYMGVGGAGSTSRGVNVLNDALTGTSQIGVRSGITGTSSGTALLQGFASTLSTAATAYTVSDVVGFIANNVTKGAGSTITNQHGLYIADQTQGTNNYGITSLVSSGTNKWNIYASGTAANYFAGDVQLYGKNLYFRGTAQSGINTNDNAGNYDISGSFTAGRYGFNVGTGYHFLSTAPYGAQGTAITYTERMRVGLTEAVFNEPGNDYDFRIESDTNSHAFFLEGSTGNVGIGTSSPYVKLDVSMSNSVVYNGATGTYAAPAVITNTSTVNGNSISLGFHGKTDTAADYVGATVDAIFDSHLSTSKATSLAFRTFPAGASTPVERLRLDSAGNLGLGVAPSASWWASIKSIGVGRLGNGIFGSTGDDEVNIGANVINTGSGTYIYGATDTASLYRQVAAQHVWYYAGSGTAGTALTPTEAMRINASGSVGIGTSSPSYALSVVKNTTGAHAVDVLNSTTGAGSSRLILRNTSDTSGSGFQIINNAQDGNVNILNYKNSALAFWTNATQRLTLDSAGYLRMASGSGGIQFNGDTAAANALDDYEEGSWTPVIEGLTTTGTGTYGIQHGVYTKVGNLVTISLFLQWTAHTGSGSMIVTGLPFSAASSAVINLQAGGTYASSFNAGTGATQLITYVSGNTYVFFRGFVNGGTRTEPQVQANGQIGVTITYRV